MEISKNIIQYPNLNYKDRVKQLEMNYRAERQTELEKAFLSPEYWQILNNVEKNKTNAFLKTKEGIEIPVLIDIRKQQENQLEAKTIYSFKNSSEKIGYLELIEKPTGAHILKVENLNPAKYKGVNILADKIAVENCLKRGLKDFEITGDAMWNSHAAHYLSGKRFRPVEAEKAKILFQRYGTNNPNIIVKNIIENTPKGKLCHTENLKTIGFYLPKNLIKKYIQLSKIKPLLK